MLSFFLSLFEMQWAWELGQVRDQWISESSCFAVTVYYA